MIVAIYMQICACAYVHIALHYNPVILNELNIYQTLNGKFLAGICMHILQVLSEFLRYLARNCGNPILKLYFIL